MTQSCLLLMSRTMKEKGSYQIIDMLVMASRARRSRLLAHGRFCMNGRCWTSLMSNAGFLVDDTKFTFPREALERLQAASTPEQGLPGTQWVHLRSRLLLQLLRFRRPSAGRHQRSSDRTALMPHRQPHLDISAQLSAWYFFVKLPLSSASELSKPMLC